MWYNFRRMEMLRLASLLFWLIAGCLMVASAQEVPKTAPPKAVKETVVHLKDANGSDVGSATIRSKGQAVEIKLALKAMPPGQHAVHFHQTAKCEPPDFKSAGPHFNPANKEHGLENPNGHHAGDMPNVTVKPDGKAKATIKNDAVVLGTGAEANSLFVNGGTALVIHAKPDDMKTNPAGNAGDRIACGVITK